MKVVVIIALGLAVMHSMVRMSKGVDEDSGGELAGGILLFIFDTLALVFCCIGWN